MTLRFFFFAGALVSQRSRCAVLPLLAEILFPAFDPQHLRDGFAFRVSLAEPGMKTESLNEKNGSEIEGCVDEKGSLGSSTVTSRES